MITQINPSAMRSNLFSFGNPGELDLSRTMKPSPPRENMKLAAKPSIMYCPLTRYGINAT